MDGYIAKLKDIRALADRYHALIMVDDCHATGFLGPQGKGSYAYHGVDVDFVTGTFGKALGTFGAFVAGPADLVETLLQRARTYIYTTALPPAVAAGLLAFYAFAKRQLK